MSARAARRRRLVTHLAGERVRPAAPAAADEDEPPDEPDAGDFDEPAAAPEPPAFAEASAEPAPPAEPDRPPADGLLPAAPERRAVHVPPPRAVSAGRLPDPLPPGLDAAVRALREDLLDAGGAAAGLADEICARHRDRLRVAIDRAGG